MPKETKNISDRLNRLEEIVEWFETSAEVDVETGLEKVKEGAALLKDLKARLKAAENEFKEIKKELSSEEQ